MVTIAWRVVAVSVPRERAMVRLNLSVIVDNATIVEAVLAKVVEGDRP